MESLGAKLRNAREAKSLTFEQASRETNIAVRYLEALETENFAANVFPGEPYIIGFLRNYGAYLDLNVTELLSLRRALKIQEQDIPVAQLLKVPSKAPKIAATVAVIVAVLGAGGGVFFFMTRPPETDAGAPAPRTPVEHVMNSESLERRFYKGDSLLVPLEASQYKLELVNLGEAVTIRAPGGTVILDLSQESAVDLNNDGVSDLRITAAEFAKNNPDMGVQLRFDMNGVPAIPPPAAADTPAVNLANATVIFSAPSSYSFTLEGVFQGYCMFRWEILFERDRRERKEEYFSRGQPINIQAQNGIRIWSSNAQAAKFQVIGGGRSFPIELGGAGEVVVAEIRWVRDNDNRYRLVLARLETGNT